MARFNQLAGKSPGQRTRRSQCQAARRESLEARGVDIAAIMAELDLGERRACAEAERRLGLRWAALIELEAGSVQFVRDTQPVADELRAAVAKARGA